jgi:phospholipid/cholesterol/gamma-HCH transport system substrate-binding protein
MNKPWMVGAFVLAGLALFATGLFMIGNRHEAFARHTEFYVEFSDLSGIAKGAKVQVAGMDAGEVIDVRVPASPTEKFRVKLRINERLRGLVRIDSLVTVNTEGVVGNKFLSIRAGTAHAPAEPPDGLLPSKEPTELSALLDEAKGTIIDIDATVRNANGLVGNANRLMSTVGNTLNSALGDVRVTVGNANDVVVGLKEGKGSAGMLLRDEAIAGQVRQAVTNTQDATTKLNDAAEHTSQLISEVQAQGFPGKVDEALTGVKETVGNLNVTSKQVRQSVSDFAGPDERGLTAVENLQEALSNANNATANLADDTEALKHNFLLRGFFKSRGYFDLDRLPPGPYRKDPFFSARDNRRAWLRAADLFHDSSGGAEELTKAGEGLLDATLSQYGAEIVQSPVVVEGYSDSPSNAERLAVSRARSIAVRNYVRSHLNLDPTNIGSVALENQTPTGLDRASWDGIAIVILKSSRRR